MSRRYEWHDCDEPVNGLVGLMLRDERGAIVWHGGFNPHRMHAELNRLLDRAEKAESDLAAANAKVAAAREALS